VSGSWVAVGLLGLSGFLLGGGYATWRTARPVAGLLGVLALLALAGALAWLA